MAELRCTSEVVYATLVELRRIRVDSSQQQVINSMVSHDGKLAGVNVDRIFPLCAHDSNHRRHEPCERKDDDDARSVTNVTVIGEEAKLLAT